MNGSGVGVFINRKSSKSCENTAKSSKSILSLHFPKPSSVPDWSLWSIQVPRPYVWHLCITDSLHLLTQQHSHRAVRDQYHCVTGTEGWLLAKKEEMHREVLPPGARGGGNLNFMLNRLLPAGGSTSTSKVRTLQDKTICVSSLW